jgi:hypothetical protein
MRSRRRLAVVVMMMSVLWGERMVADQFYTLASVQAVPVRGGTAIRLMATGPVAFGALPDPEAPPGVQRIRLRLYGVNAVADGALAPNGVAGVTAVPDTHGKPGCDDHRQRPRPLASVRAARRPGRAGGERGAAGRAVDDHVSVEESAGLKPRPPYEGNLSNHSSKEGGALAGR